jgi:gas vesicle protein
MKRSTKILLGLSAIFAAGAVTGILFAPDKGERTRGRISRKSRWLYNTANDTYEESRDQLNEIRDNLKYQMDKMNEKIDRMSKCS